MPKFLSLIIWHLDALFIHRWKNSKSWYLNALLIHMLRIVNHDACIYGEPLNLILLFIAETSQIIYGKSKGKFLCLACGRLRHHKAKCPKGVDPLTWFRLSGFHLLNVQRVWTPSHGFWLSGFLLLCAAVTIHNGTFYSREIPTT